MIRAEGGLWDQSAALYPVLGGNPKESRNEWDFPSGATIRFSHLQLEKNIYDWQGSEIPFIGFDELTHFSESQFFYLLSRSRSTGKVKPHIRCTCNPDADSWVAEFIDWWIGDDGFPIPDRAGKIRWFMRQSGEIVWADSPDDFEKPHLASAFTFIPAKIADNQVLMTANPEYLANLESQHPVERARLLDGNWRIKWSAGKVFERAWFQVIDTPPQGGIDCRFWDLAATEKEVKNDACFTAGVKIRKLHNRYYILDVIAERLSPGATDRLIKSVAEQDGGHCLIRWEIEPGSAGKRDIVHLTEMLKGYDCKGIRPQGDKLTRAKPLARAAATGVVSMVRSSWTDDFLSTLHSCPDIKFWDKIDAAAGAFNVLSKWGDLF